MMTYILLILAQLGLLGPLGIPAVPGVRGAAVSEVRAPAGLGAPSGVMETAAIAPSAESAAAVCAAAPSSFPEGPDPLHIPLTTSRHGGEATGEARLSFAASPFGIAVDQEGRHVYRIELQTSGLEIPGRTSSGDSADPAAGPAGAGHVTAGGSATRPGAQAVAWVATPDLDRVLRLGILREDGTLTGRVAFNKFLLFVTAETDADRPSAEARRAPAADGAVERWSGPILLSGISRSGLLHTMAGHGPFEGEPC